ncbi:hypothetical protein ACIQKE_31200 [Streptomyces griseoviridis]|uniref:FxLD family lantipeptide n=1 Tax=Streptomyces hintoniae TaxID=3075521 RepID=A0ABU2UK92_9ACTN|nr:MULTISPECIES: hypothetical protein [Streptomyces]MDH6699146.1 hypothetical protein [Streptomyces sp. MAA16]MDT0473689.1 hypothetical protein [Streptomyces sp. DSM 41014]
METEFEALQLLPAEDQDTAALCTVTCGESCSPGGTCAVTG